MTDCTAQQYLFQAPGRREVVGAFNGGTITSDGGVVLVREGDERRRLVVRFTACFRDFCDPGQIEHMVEGLVLQRIYGLVLGYEDLNDHEKPRRDPLLATAVVKIDPLGRSRRQAQDRGKALAGKSTLNRLEWGWSVAAEDDRYRRIAVDPGAVDRFRRSFSEVVRRASPPDRS